MRVIAGRFKGRRLIPPSGDRVRPTSDRLRETLFNVIAAAVPGARVLDGYARTGAVGIEALSRGALEVTFIERDRHAVRLIRSNVQLCGVEDACVIIRADLESADPHLRTREFDLILLDPPYHGTDLDAVLVTAANWLAADGLLVLEHARRVDPPLTGGGLRCVRDLVSGDSALAFYRRASDAERPHSP
jgi:16S rRNA (guanine(966)-N(2))-methyltransferase RsmD